MIFVLPLKACEPSFSQYSQTKYLETCGLMIPLMFFINDVLQELICIASVLRTKYWATRKQISYIWTLEYSFVSCMVEIVDDVQSAIDHVNCFYVLKASVRRRLGDA